MCIFHGEFRVVIRGMVSWQGCWLASANRDIQRRGTCWTFASTGMASFSKTGSDCSMLSRFDDSQGLQKRDGSERR
jgi:hypothetical protein